MSLDARQRYLESQVVTATPQKLRLMLIDGAIRFAREARQALLADDTEAGLALVTQCRNIVAELLGSLPTATSALAKEIARVHAFVFERLADVQLRHEIAGLDDAIRVLEEEGRTWRELCAQMADLSPTDPSSGKPSRTMTAASPERLLPAPLPPAPPVLARPLAPARERVSFEA